MDAMDRLDQFMKTGHVSFSVANEADGLFVSISRAYTDEYGENHEDYWGNYFDDMAHGLNECMNILERLDFNRNLKRHNITVVK